MIRIERRLAAHMNETPFPANSFDREDDAPDASFYREPRLLVHIDDGAIDAVRALYAELLPAGGDILDLMSSYRSHMPADLKPARLCGLGMNEVELRENVQLTDFVVHDVNANPVLPFADAEFDAAVVTVSVQYLTQPVEVFREVARVLKPGSVFALTYSSRAFWTKAVRIWRALDDSERASLIGMYFRRSGAFDEPTARNCRPDAGGLAGDPLYAVWARTLA
jgi:SAM-dependent methyltransferase